MWRSCVRHLQTRYTYIWTQTVVCMQDCRALTCASNERHDEYGSIPLLSIINKMYTTWALMGHDQIWEIDTFLKFMRKLSVVTGSLMRYDLCRSLEYGSRPLQITCHSDIPRLQSLVVMAAIAGENGLFFKLRASHFLTTRGVPSFDLCHHRSRKYLEERITKNDDTVF